MERRDRSLKALEELIYIHSLDDTLRAQRLVLWVESYLSSNGFADFDLELAQLEQLSELIYANFNFLKRYRSFTREELLTTQKMRKFVEHS